MNLSLVDPFVLAHDCPETLIESLHSGHSTCIRFNRKGDLLASGRLDGTISIFDIETSGVARKLRGHTRQVQSLSWSSCGRYLLSASQDWKCVLWDLKDGSRVRTVRFEAAVFIAELHPANHLLFVAALFEDQPVLVDLSGDIPVKRTLPSAPKRTQAERDNPTEKQLAQDAKQTTTVTIFSPSGKHILTGTNRGWLNIIETSSCETLCSTRLTNCVVILLRLTQSGRNLVVNSSDRVIRTLHLPDLDNKSLDFENLRIENEHKYQDIVNHLSWNHVTFSASGEYIVASILMQQHLYVWETGQGSLEKILEGPKEELSVVEWHPHKPILAACGMDSGLIFIWSIVAPQRWSALAPDFAEVEENQEYVEREDEFDVHPVEEIHKRILHQEDEEIDVLTLDSSKRQGTFEEGDFQMPVLLDIDNSDSDDDLVGVGAGQYRRKSPGQGKEWALEDGAAGPASGDDQSNPRTPIKSNNSPRSRSANTNR
ncbi:MAG: chromatin binding protein [Chrysothrix sp. TS-e1954]|nr:MAG: chromatin binding protein [Chrysothrix sp. TS-e1954]